jgi:tRNA threonylcarbamoyladenosine biosynthesis protein TsaE
LLSTPQTRHVTWPDEAACAETAHALARHAALDDACIELYGPLGAGKTTFVRHLLHALGVPGRIKSPTYALMEPYELARPQGPLHIWHFDFYRLEDPQEWEDAGFRELYASAGLKLAEWPEQAERLLPRADLRIHIDPVEPARRDDVGASDPSSEPRRVRLEPQTERGLELLA